MQHYNPYSNQNLVQGTIFEAQLPVFTGSYKNAKFSHNVSVKMQVIKESYGAERGQHTFTLLCLESSHPEDFAVGKTYRKKGRNLYPNICANVQQPDNYLQVAAEKDDRSRYSAAAKRRRLAENTELYIFKKYQTLYIELI